jgi:hypothetical protein
VREVGSTAITQGQLQGVPKPSNYISSHFLRRGHTPLSVRQVAHGELDVGDGWWEKSKCQWVAHSYFGRPFVLTIMRPWCLAAPVPSE